MTFRRSKYIERFKLEQLEPRVLLSGGQSTARGSANLPGSSSVNLTALPAPGFSQPTIKPATSAPDIAVYTPAGWSAPVVVSIVPGTTTNAATIHSTDSLYIDWAFINQGTANATTTFHSEIVLDNSTVIASYAFGGVAVGYYYALQDTSIAALSAGTHTITLKTDYLNEVPGNLKTNPNYTATFTVIKAPAIGSFTAVYSSSPSKVTLTANNVTESGATISSISFLMESNGIAGLQTGSGGDTVVASGTKSGNNWSAILSTTGYTPGVYTFYPLATDSGGLSGASGTNALVAAPTVGSPTTSGTWSNLASSPPSNGDSQLMIQLSDGTVMVHGGADSSSTLWYKLTPNTAGSYVNGTWSTLASMTTGRLFFASNVLKDGRVFVQGGEYSGPSTTETDNNTGEIYNPVTNSWSALPAFPQSAFGDDPSIVLANGNVLAGYLAGADTYLYNPTANTWTATGSKLRSDASDEECWCMLPDGSILSYDVFGSLINGAGHAQRYIPSTGQWVDAGTLPAYLSTPAQGYELGPGLLLPNGRVLYLGANGNTAYYTPSSDTWSAGPAIPNDYTLGDAPSAILPDGNVLLAASPAVSNGNFPAPTRLYELNPTTNIYTDVTPSSSVLGLSSINSFIMTMLVLPTGQVLVTADDGHPIAVYTPTQFAQTAWQPTISKIVKNADGSFTLTGTQINGMSQGAEYGDDNEMDTNFPLVQLTDTATGKIYYAKSYNWSTTQVQSGNTPETVQFTLPAGIGSKFTVKVCASGISSAAFTIPAPTLTASQVGDGTAQRSVVKSIQVTFSEPVNFNAGSFSLFKEPVDAGGNLIAGSPTDISATVSATNPSSDGMSWVITINSGNSLADGIYQLVLHGANITDAATGLANFNAGADQIVSFTSAEASGGISNYFHVLYGDINGDGFVDGLDLRLFKLAFGSSDNAPTGPADSNWSPGFDENGDGFVDGLDLRYFKFAFGGAFTY